MKILSLIVIVALILCMPSLASALSLGVSATVTSGTSLGTYDLIACNGYNWSDGDNPWTSAACYSIKTKQTVTVPLVFGGKGGVGALVTKLYDASGQETVGADCFYAANFYIVYFYPDAWGGKGYQISQSSATLPLAIQDSVVFTPVYSPSDMFKWVGGEVAQGALDQGTEPTDNPDINKSKLARTGGLILKSKRARIVRAQYGIPPKPGPSNASSIGWQAIPLTATAGTYSASLTISLVEWQ